MGAEGSLKTARIVRRERPLEGPCTEGPRPGAAQLEAAGPAQLVAANAAMAPPGLATY